MAGKFKDRVDEISAAFYSTTNNISDLKTMVATAKKVVFQAESKVSSLKK